jgi:D-serine deaminase-like pyridoxal phosphate-dependent protein
VEKLNAEHCYIKLAAGARQVRVGDKVEMYVPYVDGTFNLYDKIYAVRRDKIEKIWQTSGRGRSN